jgi:hypothetical protein
VRAARRSHAPPRRPQHAEEVLLDMGYDWEQIIAMKERGAIP